MIHITTVFNILRNKNRLKAYMLIADNPGITQVELLKCFRRTVNQPMLSIMLSDMVTAGLIVRHKDKQRNNYTIGIHEVVDGVRYFVERLKTD